MLPFTIPKSIKTKSNKTEKLDGVGDPIMLSEYNIQSADNLKVGTVKTAKGKPIPTVQSLKAAHSLWSSVNLLRIKKGLEFNIAHANGRNVEGVQLEIVIIETILAERKANGTYKSYRKNQELVIV